MKAWLLLTSSLLLHIISVSCIYVWHANENSNKNAMAFKYMKVEEEENKEYDNHIRRFANYTIDQKCQNGLDFGIGYQLTHPYVDVGGSSSNGYSIVGILPEVTKKILGHCCKRSNISFARFFISIEEIERHVVDEGEIDLYFPIYGMDGKKSTDYKGFPFVPIVTAPRIVMLVPDYLFQQVNPRMQVLITTIFNAWPMLIFIIVSTMLAGLIVWFLDRKQNSVEFPPTFYSGAWEGIWWAFVTMTTVGYGDRSPKSLYARAFCIMWILVGIVLISLFTGLVTSALSASSTPVFNIAGSKIGAVRGSVEYQVGVGYNAEMKAFDNHLYMLENLTLLRNMHAVMIDNFILSANADFLTNNSKVRMAREIEHPITYGITFSGKKASSTVECFRKYVSYNSHEIFEMISKKLVPINNPTDKVRLEVSASESFFYEDSIFKVVVYSEVGILIIMFIAGVLWEQMTGTKRLTLYQKLRKRTSKDYHLENSKADGFDLRDIKTESGATNSIFSNAELQALISEYDEYHAKWIQRVQNASHPPPPIIRQKKDYDADKTNGKDHPLS